MKTRIGFVSNSSSASFILPKYKASEYQLNKLRDYMDSTLNEDGWYIYEDGEYDFRASTNMDNDAIDIILKNLELEDKVYWESY